MADAYKIRRRSDGLFSTGGRACYFTPQGKIWKKLGHVKLHLRQVNTQRRDPYADCDIVHFSLVEVATQPVNELRSDVQRRAREKAEASRAASVKAREELELREFARLKAKYGE